MFEYNAFHIAPWGHELVVYFTLIGIVAFTYILASVPAVVEGGDAFAKVQKPGYILVFIALLVCAVLLITDLGQPQRFMNILIYHHWSSPLVWGSVLLIGFGACSALALFSTLVRPDQNLLRWAALLGSILAVGFPLYTGLDLAGNQGRVLWHDPMVPVLFVALSASSGAGVVAVLGMLVGDSANNRMYGVLRRVIFWASLATLAMFVLMWVRLNYGNAQEMQIMAMINDGLGFEYWGLSLFCAGILPALLSGIRAVRNNPMMIALAGVLAIVGAYAYRDIIMHAGQLPQLYY